MSVLTQNNYKVDDGNDSIYIGECDYKKTRIFDWKNINGVITIIKDETNENPKKNKN